MGMFAGCKEVLKKKKRFVSRQTSVFYFFKSFSGTRASPPALLDTGDDVPAYWNREKLNS
jgi:hypothetical protein